MFYAIKIFVRGLTRKMGLGGKYFKCKNRLEPEDYMKVYFGKIPIKPVKPVCLYESSPLEAIFLTVILLGFAMLPFISIFLAGD